MITNIIVFFSVFIMLAINQKYSQAIFWLTCWFVNLALSSFSNLMGTHVGKKIAIIISAIWIIAFSFAVTLYINKMDLVMGFFSAETYISTLILLICFLAIAVLFSVMARMKFRNTSRTNLLKKSFNWLKKIDIMVYKDYLLVGSKVGAGIVTSIFTYILLCEGLNNGFKVVFTIICLNTDWFAAKKKREYLLLVDDFLFDENIFSIDREYIRRKKRLTIFSGSLLKILLLLILVTLEGVFNIHVFLLES